MRLLLAMSLLLGICSQARAQYEFYVTTETPDSHSFCAGNLITFHLEYKSGYRPDSAFVIEGTERIIDNSGWTRAGREYTFIVALKPNTYDPALHIYKNGTLNRLLLHKKISVHGKPKASFKFLDEPSICSGSLFTCLKDESNTGLQNHPITDILINWGDGESSNQLADTLCHIYTDGGSNELTYTVVDSTGCKDSVHIVDSIFTKPGFSMSKGILLGKLDSVSQNAALEIALKGSAAFDSLKHATVHVQQIADAHGLSTTFSNSYVLKKKANGFVDPLDKMAQKLGVGKYSIKIAITSAGRCQDTLRREVIVGHLSTAKIDVKCAQESVHFSDSNYYWYKTGQAYCEQAKWSRNSTCVDQNNFFKYPKGIRTGMFGRFPNYTLPETAERVAWDFQNDGIIDEWDVHTPRHKYEDGGNKVCALWSLDSTGVWQKSLLKFYLNEVKPVARLANGLTYICPPQTEAILFQDTSRKAETITTVLENGHRSNPDSPQFSLNINNNTPLSFTIQTESGCRVSFVEQNAIKILGAQSNFERISNDSICAGDFMEYRNTSGPAKYEWLLGGKNKGIYEYKSLFMNDLKTDYYHNKKMTVRLLSTTTEYNPDTKKEETCTTEFPNWNPSRMLISQPQSCKLIPNQRLGTAEMQFKVLDSLPKNATNYYSINGGPKQLITKVTDVEWSSWNFNIDFGNYGKYDVCLFSYTPLCSDSFCTTIWTEDVGMGDVNNSHINAYPNPVTDVLTLSSKEQGWYEIRNLTGQLLLSDILKEGPQQVDLSLLAKGSYILQVQTEEESLSMPLVKN